MSNKRYIQIESTYRDRKSWRNPSEFEIPLNQRVQNRHTAYDAVCDSAPIHQWKVNEFNVGASVEKVLRGFVDVNFVDGSGTAGLTSAGDQKTIIIKFVTIGTNPTEDNVPQKIKDYYVGAVMEANVYNILSSDGLLKKERRRIVSSTYLAPDQYSVVGGGSSDEHYVQFTLDRNFSDDVHHGVYNDSTLTPDGATPISIIDPSFTTTSGVEKVFVPYGRLGEDSYRDYYLYNDDNEESYKITNYDPITHLLTIDSIATNTLMGKNVCIRKSLPLHRDTILASGTKDIEVPVSNLNTEEDFYKGHYIRIVNGVDSENVKIVKSEFISTSSRIKFTFNEIITSSSLTVAEILGFSRDNLSSLNYTGSTVSNQESKCHEIELLNMILPNKIVKNGNGSRLTYYPYLYVEFTNITSPTSNGNNIIYSNNPNSKKCIFKATMDDIPNPLTSPFIKIDGDGMLQTIKFKVNDNLKFVVRLPNGEPLEFDEEDTITPVEPDPYSQISALFSVRQL
jgi:hypothetical protein